MEGITIQNLYIGMSESLVWTFSEADSEKFAALTGDVNPVHLDADYADKTIFQGKIVHGMLVSSLFSNLFGTKLPGLGSIYIRQSLHFVKPVRFGEQVEAKVIVRALNPVRNRAYFDCFVTNGKGEIVLEGEAEIMPPKEVHP